MFYHGGVRVEYREEPCRGALNRVKGMPFDWSLNPYMGCVHRCTFCYVRAFEQRADRPSDDRYGTSIRVKTNVAEVLRRELARPVVGARGGRDRRRDRPVPARRGPLPADARLHRGARATPRTRSAIITRGPMIVRDVDVLAEAARRADVVGDLLDPDARRGRLAQDRAVDGAPAPAAARAEGARRRGDQGERRHGADPPRHLRRPEQLAEVVRAAREAGATRGLGERPLPAAGDARALPRAPRARLARAARALRASSTRGRAYLGAEHTKPIRAQVAELRAASSGSRDRAERRRSSPSRSPSSSALAI